MKHCSKCGAEKRYGEFFKNRSRPDGYGSQCKTCHASYPRSKRSVDSSKAYYAKNRDRELARCKRWRSNNPHKLKRCMTNSNLKKSFGLSLAQYETLLAAQSGSCAICDVTPEKNGKALSVDHDHATGTIRGLLCNNCNVAIGFLRDSASIAQSAAVYLGSPPLAHLNLKAKAECS